MGSLTKAKRRAKVGGSHSFRGSQVAPKPRKPITKRTYSGRMAIRLRTLRESSGKSGASIADAIGVPRITYYKWESGENKIDADYFPKLAKVLGVTSDAFFPEF